MSLESVLVVPVSGPDGSRVLINASGSAEPSLELTLLGTDESYVYKAVVRKTNTSQLRAKSYRGSDEEWTAILAHAFLRKKPDDEFQDLTTQVELVANLQPGKDLVLVLRRMVSGIAQRLGSITLEVDEQDIGLFDWAATAAASVAEVETTTQDLQRRYDAQQETIDQLTAQLQDLIKAKEQQENELLDKFRQLLNSKKAKIRDQARLLSTAQVDANTAGIVRETRKGRSNPTPRTTKRRGKRSADVPLEEEEDIEVDEAELAVADEGRKLNAPEDEDDDERAATPDREVTDDTDDGDAFNEAPQVKSGRITRASQQKTEVDAAEAKEPPPPRSLPFSMKAAAEAKKAQEAKATETGATNNGKEDEEDTDDDEL